MEFSCFLNLIFKINNIKNHDHENNKFLNSTKKQLNFLLKNMFLSILFLSATLYTNAENKEVIIKSKIDKVTVFLSSAQVFRS